MTTEKKGFDLGDYVQVKDRIRVFYELYGQGRLVTGEVRLTTEPDGKPRVLVQGLAYRTPDDLLPGVGWSWMELPGTTSYTKGSELENTETSAWGRAIGSLGILIEGSIATTNEIDSKKDDGKVPAARALKSVKPHDPEKSLIGKAELGKADSGVDFEVHDGQLAFRLTQGNTGYKVVTSGLLAEQLALHRDELLGERVKVWGSMESEAFVRKHQPVVWYSVVHAIRVDCGDLSLPVEPEPDEAVPEPMWPDEAELAAIQEAEMAEAAAG
jgi:hypothetical protein